jgi:hypothetical protein
MQVDVPNRLAAIAATIKNTPIALLGNAELACHVLGGDMHVAEQRRIISFNVNHAGDVLAWND